MSRLLCFGYGYTAHALGRLLTPRGWRVIGTVRDPEEPGLLAFRRDHRLRPQALEGVTHILASIPPDDLGDPVLDEMWQSIVRMNPPAQWIGYLSSVGVYGDHGGRWADETTLPAPTSERARRRATAEASWLVLARQRDLPVHAFRLAGIYGPGRSALDEVRAGTARRIVKPGHLFNRIHVDDIVRVLIASMARPNPGAIYNVADDEPAAQADVIAFAAELLRKPLPPLVSFEQAALAEKAASFWADNRKVRNERIKRELGVTLAYPTFREGLRGILLAGG